MAVRRERTELARAPRGASRLSPSFFARDALEVARDLLGHELRRGAVRLRIVEVEAYRWPGDSANHARAGRTARNAAMFGPAGRAYVYLCYGIHNLLNLVCGPEGEAAAVLIRACEPLAGLETIEARRGVRAGRGFLAGPGKVGQALAVDPALSGHDLCAPGGLSVHRGLAPPPSAVLAGPRIGIDYAEAADRAAPWRLAIAGSRGLARAQELRPRA
ncbi:MAG: DNA-3-methyladenine glycosylase [Nannocystaceae bacterium]